MVGQVAEKLTQIDQLRIDGLLGSPLDFTWDGEKHICCGTRRSYYHRKGCKACTVGLHNELKDLYEQEQREEIRKTPEERAAYRLALLRDVQPDTVAQARRDDLRAMLHRELDADADGTADDRWEEGDILLDDMQEMPEGHRCTSRERDQETVR
jgi:hypothetical protein